MRWWIRSIGNVYLEAVFLVNMRTIFPYTLQLARNELVTRMTKNKTSGSEMDRNSGSAHCRTNLFRFSLSMNCNNRQSPFIKYVRYY